MTQVMFQSAYRQLTPTQRAFVDNTVAHIEQAAHRANERIDMALYRPIPSEIVERSNGLLENRLVQAAITERINEIASEQELTAARWVKQARALAFSNISDFMRPEGDDLVFDFSLPTPEQWSAVKSIEIEGGSDDPFTRKKNKIKLTFWDKPSAMKMLGQYMGLLEPDNPHWKADIARVQGAAPLPAGATAEDAGDAYQQYLT